jgi:serine/threonine protein kinase
MIDDEIEVQLRALARTHALSEAAVEDLRAWVASLMAATRSLPPTFSPGPEEQETVMGSLLQGTAALPEQRFEFRGALGSGAMGEVFRVWDRGLRRNLALKTLRTDRAQASGMIARFVAEAQLTAQLRHPAIVPVHELGRLPDGRLYYTMREIRGRTLGDRIRALHAASPSSWGTTEEGWDLQRLVSAFAAACEAVAHAHARGVVHRDLKPANVMIGEFDEVWVLDWGVAKLVGHAETHDPVETDRGEMATQVGDVVGTPAYMAPEQAYGWNDRVDARADVYALGAILYELLSNRPPYVPEPGRPVLAQVLEGPPPAAGRRKPAPPRALAALCADAMARDRTARPQDASEVAARLNQWLGRRPAGR